MLLSAWLMIEMSPLVPLTLQLLLPLPCHCSVAEVEGGATLIEGPRQGDVATDVATEVNRGRASRMPFSVQGWGCYRFQTECNSTVCNVRARGG